MFCRKCGAEIAEGSTTCPYCGTRTKNANREYVSTQIDKIKNSDKLNEVKDEVKEKVSNFKKPTKPAIIAIGAALAVIIIVICAVSGSGSVTSKMKKALKDNDYQSVEIEYYNAMSDSSKLKKVDKLIADKLNDMIKDIDKFDFKSEAQNNDQAVNTWLAQYGTLMSSEYHYSGEDFPLGNCISMNNQALWNELCGKISDAQSYCDGVRLYNQKDYSGAVERLCIVDEESGCYSDSQSLISESLNQYIDAVIKEADSYMSSGDYDTAIQTLDDAGLRFNDDESLTGYADNISKKLAEAKANHAQSYATKAEECFNKKDVYSAISNIKFALELAPDSAAYQSSKAKYEQYLPFALYEENNVLKKEGSLYFNNSRTANDNTEQQNVACYDAAVTEESNKCTYTYKLGKKYDTVGGTLFLPQDDKDNKNQLYFIAYADGKKIYTSKYMTAGVLPQKISFNVSDVDTLTIEAFCINGERYGSDLYISNFVAQKEFK